MVCKVRWEQPAFQVVQQHAFLSGFVGLSGTRLTLLTRAASQVVLQTPAAKGLTAHCA